MPDAPGDRARCAGRLPDLRYGFGADGGHGRRGRRCRVARSDAAVVGRCRAIISVGGARDVAHDRHP
ncbi:MAG: hypothetical protein U1F59_00230 [Candidatus Competibacteraceae bacterium]